MASFELKNGDTGVQYVIEVAEFVYRNTYGTNAKGDVTSMEETGYTSITNSGDNIIEKLGRDAIESKTKFYFVNHPDYYIQLDKLTLISTTSRSIDPTSIEGERELTIDYSIYYGNINVYRDNGINLGLFIQYWKVLSKKSYENTEPTLSMTLPALSPNSEALYNQRIAYNFAQKQLAFISPYSYLMQSFVDPNTSFRFTSNVKFFGNMTPIFAGKQFTIRNAATPNFYGVYNFDDNSIITRDDIKNYGDLAKKNLIGSAYGDGTLFSSTITFKIIPISTKMDGKTRWEFMYWLLFDTESSDNPYPDKNEDPSGQSPTNTGGSSGYGNGTGDTSSDEILPPSYPTVNPINTGSVNLYEMTGEEFRDFMSYIWTDFFFTTIIKLFQDPMQAIISAHIIGIEAPTIKTDNITIGNVTTTVQAKVVKNNFTAANFSYIEIPEFYGDSSDYLNTVIELYLPYYGYVTLNTLEVMGAKVYLSYTIDVLTGAFVAFVTVEKNVDGTNLKSVLYQYNGNMAYQIPISSVNYSSFVTAAISAVGALSQKTIAQKAEGLINAGLSVDIGYDRAGVLSGDVGYMGIKVAYIAILRPIHKLPPNFAKYIGFPYEGYVNLGSCVGFTKCREVIINNVIGSEEETAEIKQLLENGVIF